MRILASGSILLALCLACALPAPDDDVAPEPTEATEPEPSLDPAPSGLTPTDSALTVDRCVRTAWSYYGCEASFPVQGRTWIAWACRTAGQRPGGDLGAVSDSDELGGAGLDDELGQLRGEAPAARPADEQDRYRATVCARWADYRIRGVGGAVEREAGLAALQEICDGGDRVACAHLAEILQYTDMDRARALTARACDDPERSPMVLCDDLRNATSGGLERYDFTLTTATGIEGLAPGAACSAWVLRSRPRSDPRLVSDGRCSTRVACGDRVFYGLHGSVCPCRFDGRDVVAGEDMTTGEDGDPAVSIDSAAGRFVVRDDASGELGAFELRAGP